MIEIPNTPYSGPGQSLTLVGYSSVLPKIPNARRLTEVILSCLQQTDNPQNYSVFPCTAIRALTLTDMCLGKLVTRCESFNKCSGALWTITLHQGSNIAYFSVVNFETFLVYIYKLQPVQFAKMMTLFRVRTGGGVLVLIQ